MKNFIIRHGDLIISKIDKLPTGPKKKKGNIILHGTVTTHAHRLIGGDILEKGDTMYLSIKKKGAFLSHEEHAKIDMPIGSYIILRTREYDYGSRSPRLVKD